MYNAMTESLQSIHRNLTALMPGAKYQTRPKPKQPRLGLAEMRQLIDHDALNTACPENAEQHHVIWCIGHQTAVCAGSIGDNADRKGKYLRWRDIDLSHEGGNRGCGRFKAVIRFNYLKANRDDPAHTHRNLECHLGSPNNDDIVFSVPHRLLVIAIR